MLQLTQELARFVASPPVRNMPLAAATVIRQGFIDTVATMAAGRHESVVRIVREWVAAKASATCEAGVLLGQERAPAADAALINATAAHALDYDDVALGGHPSTVLVPALIAEGEAIAASGGALMRAYLVGYELWAELIARDADAHHVKGWHPTGVFGTIAVAAAIAHLRAVDEQSARQALGIAASMASGLVANFGTMTKPFHAGRAAAAGIDAVRLAMKGMSAASDAIEHHAGFLAAISPKGNIDLERPVQLGRGLRILEAGLSVKKYPLCYATHRVIDAVIDLAEREDLDPDTVQDVQATIGLTQHSMLRNHAPTSALEAKFSLEFAVAAALIERKVGLAQLSDEFVNRAPVRATMSKVAIDTVASTCPIEPVFAYADRVRIRLRNGRELDSGDIRFARGNLKLALREGELENKFMDCFRDVEHLHAASLYAQLVALEAVPNVALLTTHAQAGASLAQDRAR